MIYMEMDLSYEEEQIQILIQRQLMQEKDQQERDRKRAEAISQREIIKKQDEEYHESLKIDMNKEEEEKEVPVFEEPTVEEMRRVRLMRFQCVG